MMPEWCEEMSVILRNTNFQNYQHIDMWLAGFLREHKARGFRLFSVLAGYNHRISMSESKEEEMKFGGMFVPPVPGGRPMTEDQIDENAYMWAPRGIREWVEECTLELRRRPKRLDVVKTQLDIDHPLTESYDHIGVYTERAEGEAGTATEATYQLVVEVPMPVDAHIEVKRPPRTKR